MKKLSPTERRSALMASIPSKNTWPEITVRRLLHAMGYRFRLHCRQLPGCPDIILAKHKAVVFVHGCFWHQHEGCAGSHLPRARTGYWWPKLERNRRRDQEAVEALRALEWRVLVVWECEIRDLEKLRERLYAFLGAAPRRPAPALIPKRRLTRLRAQSRRASG
jgi:DNA mismatch endonuclease (patch repair protein)